MVDHLAALLDGGEGVEGLLPRRPVSVGRRGETWAAEPAGLVSEEAGLLWPETVPGAGTQIHWPEDGPGRAALEWSLDGAVARAARTAAGQPRPGRRLVTVEWPASPTAVGEADWAALDRQVEREARRYDGGSTLY